MVRLIVSLTGRKAVNGYHVPGPIVGLPGLVPLESQVRVAARAPPPETSVKAANAAAAREQPRETDERLDNINDSLYSAPLWSRLGKLSIGRTDDGLPQPSAADVTILVLLLNIAELLYKDLTCSLLHADRTVGKYEVANVNANRKCNLIIS